MSSYNTSLQERIRQFLNEEGLSQSKAAPMFGLSPTALSQYLNSKYDKGDIAETERKIIEFFKLHDEKQAADEKAQSYSPVNQDYIPTSTSEDICKLIRYCQLERCLGIVCGDAGIGKTKAAEKFLQDNPTATVYVESSPATGSMRSTLKQLARELRLPDNMRTDDMAIAVREKLAEGKKIVIIDEAQHLKYMALELLSRWTDPDHITKERQIALVLIGNNEVFDRMHGNRRYPFKQQFSRMGMHRDYFTVNTLEDDVNRAFPYLKEHGMERELHFLLGISRSDWGFRGAVNIYNNAVQNEDITYDGLLAMARALGVGILG